jgi:hypothetical protein
MKLSKVWLSIKVFFVSRLYVVGLVWWKYWSKFYRSRDDDYGYITLPTGWDPESAGVVLTALRWQPDGGKELWDVCRSPKWVEFCLKCLEDGYDQPAGALDCDEFAIWSAHVLAQKYAPYMLTTSWVSNDSEILGHALCIGKLKDGRLFHLGNWGYHAGFSDLKELCEDIKDKARSDRFVAWAILDLDMTVMSWGRGMPQGREFYNVLLGKKK